MNLARLAWSYLRAKPLGTLLNIRLLALGVGTVGFVRQVIPLSPGDSFRDYRIMGTTPDYLELWRRTRIWTGLER